MKKKEIVFVNGWPCIKDNKKVVPLNPATLFSKYSDEIEEYEEHNEIKGGGR